MGAKVPIARVVFGEGERDTRQGSRRACSNFDDHHALPSAIHHLRLMTSVATSSSTWMTSMLASICWSFLMIASTMVRALASSSTP